jgi:hypothetical protein
VIESDDFSRITGLVTPWTAVFGFSEVGRDSIDGAIRGVECEKSSYGQITLLTLPLLSVSDAFVGLVNQLPSTTNYLKVSKIMELNAARKRKNMRMRPSYHRTLYRILP